MSSPFYKNGFNDMWQTRESEQRGYDKVQVVLNLDELGKIGLNWVELDLLGVTWADWIEMG